MASGQGYMWPRWKEFMLKQNPSAFSCETIIGLTSIVVHDCGHEQKLAVCVYVCVWGGGGRSSREMG